jgi:hypothetical protein
MFQFVWDLQLYEDLTLMQLQVSGLLIKSSVPQVVILLCLSWGDKYDENSM